MNPRKLNQRIKIYKQVKKHDEYGEPIEEKELIHECWAYARNKSGREQFKSVAPFNKTITSFIIRYTKKTIDTTMTIEFQGQEYNVVYVDNYNFSNEWIEITAEKVV